MQNKYTIEQYKKELRALRAVSKGDAGLPGDASLVEWVIFNGERDIPAIYRARKEVIEEEALMGEGAAIEIIKQNPYLLLCLIDRSKDSLSENALSQLEQISKRDGVFAQVPFEYTSHFALSVHAKPTQEINVQKSITTMKSEVVKLYQAIEKEEGSKHKALERFRAMLAMKGSLENHIVYVNHYGFKPSEVTVTDKTNAISGRMNYERLGFIRDDLAETELGQGKTPCERNAFPFDNEFRDPILRKLLGFDGQLQVLFALPIATTKPILIAAKQVFEGLDNSAKALIEAKQLEQMGSISQFFFYLFEKIQVMFNFKTKELLASTAIPAGDVPPVITGAKKTAKQQYKKETYSGREPLVVDLT